MAEGLELAKLYEAEGRLKLSSGLEGNTGRKTAGDRDVEVSGSSSTRGRTALWDVLADVPALAELYEVEGRFKLSSGLKGNAGWWAACDGCNVELSVVVRRASWSRASTIGDSRL